MWLLLTPSNGGIGYHSYLKRFAKKSHRHPKDGYEQEKEMFPCEPRCTRDKFDERGREEANLLPYAVHNLGYGLPTPFRLGRISEQMAVYFCTCELFQWSSFMICSSVECVDDGRAGSRPRYHLSARSDRAEDPVE